MKTLEKQNSYRLLNPFSIQLKKPGIEYISTPPVLISGDYRVYKKFDKHFLHTFKNIIIAERCSINEKIFSNLRGQTKPSGAAELYFDYESPLAALKEGEEVAKKIRFLVL